VQPAEPAHAGGGKVKVLRILRHHPVASGRAIGVHLGRLGLIQPVLKLLKALPVFRGVGHHPSAAAIGLTPKSGMAVVPTLTG